MSAAEKQKNQEKNLRDLKTFANIRSYGEMKEVGIYTNQDGVYRLNAAPSNVEEFKTLVYVAGQENN